MSIVSLVGFFSFLHHGGPVRFVPNRIYSNLQGFLDIGMYLLMLS